MNREQIKGIAIFVLDLGMELEYQRKYPRHKCIEHGALDFTFDDEGDCVVRHHDGRLGEISIDPDEITVEVTYRRKSTTIHTQSDKRLSPRDIMDIIGDFLDFDTPEDELTREAPPRIKISDPKPTQYPIRRWLIEELVKYHYGARTEAEQGLHYEQWLAHVELSKDICGPFSHTDTKEITELDFCNAVGKLGYLPQEVFEDNIRLVVSQLAAFGALPGYLIPHCKPWMAGANKQES